jgi:hypothetical protein
VDLQAPSVGLDRRREEIDVDDVMVSGAGDLWSEPGDLREVIPRWDDGRFHRSDECDVRVGAAQSLADPRSDASCNRQRADTSNRELQCASARFVGEVRFPKRAEDGFGNAPINERAEDRICERRDVLGRSGGEKGREGRGDAEGRCAGGGLRAGGELGAGTEGYEDEPDRQEPHRPVLERFDEERCDVAGGGSYQGITDRGGRELSLGSKRGEDPHREEPSRGPHEPGKPGLPPRHSGFSSGGRRRVA